MFSKKEGSLSKRTMNAASSSVNSRRTSRSVSRIVFMFECARPCYDTAPRPMLIDLSPLSKHRDFRLLFIGQLVSMFGSMMTYVAIPYQVYVLTHSSLIVGWLGAAQLVPLLLS